MGALREKMIDAMLVRGFSQATIRAYTNCMQDVCRFTGKPPLRLNAEDIRAYFVHLVRDRRLAPASIQMAGNALRFFLRLHGRHALESCVPRSKVPVQLAAVLSRGEVEAFFNALTDLRERALFMTIYCAGLRVGEASRLELRDLDTERMQIRIRSGKGSKDRVTVLFRENLELIQAYMEQYRPCGYLFFSRGKPHHALPVRRIEWLFRRARERSGIRVDASVHTLRHTFATMLLDRGVNILRIQQLLGHSSVATTMRYLHLTEVTLTDNESPMNGCAIDSGAGEENEQLLLRFRTGRIGWQ